MSHSQDRHSFKRALGVSTALHFLLVPLLVTSTILALGNARASSPPGATETTSVSYFSIEHRTKTTWHSAVAARPHRAPKTELTLDRPKASFPAPAARRAAGTTPATLPDRPRAASGRIALSPSTTAPDHPSLLARRVATPQLAVPVTPHEAVATATPAPSPTPPQTAEAAAPAMDAPPGAWGQTFDKPLVADEAALTELRSRYHAGSAVTIDVDDAGHAIRIALPSGLPDDVRVELEKRLRELRYVPAECNGLKCGGTLEITI